MGGDSQQPESAENLQETVVSGLQALPLSTLIGGPLDACIQAQAQSAQSTLDFIHQAGFVRENGQWKAVNLVFTYQKGDEKVQLTVPLLTVVPIPYIAVDKIDIEFQANVSAVSSRVFEENDDATAEGDISAGNPDQPSRRLAQPEFRANYSRQSSKKNQSESRYASEYSLDIKVSASQSSMPAGLQSILNLLQEGVSQVPAPPGLTVDPASQQLGSDQVGASVTYTASLVGDDGEDLQGREITFELDPAANATLELVVGGNTAPGLSITGESDAAGQVELMVTLTDSTFTQAQVLTLHVSSGSDHTHAELQLTVPPSPVVQSVVIQPPNAEVSAPVWPDTSTSQSFTVQVTDDADNGIADQQVQVTLDPPTGDAIPVLQIGGDPQSGLSGNGTTDQAGNLVVVVSVNQPFFDTEDLNLVATAAQGAVSGQAQISLTSLSSPELSVDPKALTFDASQEAMPHPITATLSNPPLDPASYELVFQAPDIEGVTWTLIDSATNTQSVDGSLTVSTNEQAQAEVEVTMDVSGLSEEAQGSMVISCSSLDLQTESSFDCIPQPASVPTSLAITPDSTQNLGADPLSYTVTLQDQQGQPMAGQTVHIELTEINGAVISLYLAGEQEIPGTLGIDGTTDENGKVSFNVKLDDNNLQTEASVTLVASCQGVSSNVATLDVAAAAAPTFSESGGVFTMQDVYRIDVEAIASEMSYGSSYEEPVTMQILPGDFTWDPFGDFNTPVESQFSQHLGEPCTTGSPVRYDPRLTVTVECQSWLKKNSSVSGMSDEDWKTGNLVSSTDTEMVIILKNGDPFPPTQAGYNNQPALAEILDDYIVDGVVCLGSDQAILAYELGGSSSGSAADYQDAVLLLTFSPVHAENLTLTLDSTGSFDTSNLPNEMSYTASIIYEDTCPVLGTEVLFDVVPSSADLDTSVSVNQTTTDIQGNASTQVTLSSDASAQQETITVTATAQIDSNLTDSVTTTVEPGLPVPAYECQKSDFGGNGALSVTGLYQPEIKILASETGKYDAVTVRFRVGEADDTDGSHSYYYESFGDYKDPSSDIRNQLGDDDNTKTLAASFSASLVFGIELYGIENSGHVDSSRTIKDALIIGNGYSAATLEAITPYGDQKSLYDIVQPYIKGDTVSLPANQVIVAFDLTSASTSSDAQDGVFLVTFHPALLSTLTLSNDTTFDASQLPSPVNYTATVTDTDGYPLVGEEVNFSRTYTLELATDLNASPVPTNAMGMAMATVTLTTADITEPGVVTVLAMCSDDPSISDRIDLTVEPPPTPPPQLNYHSESGGALVPNQSYIPELTIIASTTSSKSVTAQLTIGGVDYNPFGAYADPANDTRRQVGSSYAFDAAFAANTELTLSATEWSGSTMFNPKVLNDALILQDGDDAANIPNSGDHLKDVLTDGGYISNDQVVLEVNQRIVAFEIGDANSDPQQPLSCGDYMDVVFLVTFKTGVEGA